MPKRKAPASSDSEDGSSGGVALKALVRPELNGSPQAKTNGNGKRARSTNGSDSSDLSDADDDKPLAKRSKSAVATDSGSSNGEPISHPNGTNGTKRKQSSTSSSSDDDDKPLGAKIATQSSVVPSIAADSSDDDDKPLGSTTNAPKIREQMKTKKGAVKPKKEEVSPVAPRSSLGRTARQSNKMHVDSESEVESEDSEDEKPLSRKKTKKAPPKRSAPPKKKVKKEESESEAPADDSGDDSDDVPIANGSSFPYAVKNEDKPKPAPKPRTKKAKSETETPPPKPAKAKKAKAKAEEDSPTKKSRKAKKEQMAAEEEEIHRWWEQQQIQGDGSIKWNTLEHSGVLFPPPYQRLPTSVKMKYKGKEVVLSPEAEEVAGFFAALLESDHAADATFRQNFFSDWLIVMKEHPSADSNKIKNFDDCDFRPMFLHFEAEKAAKKSMTAAEKKALKAVKDELEAPYKECVLDGRKEKVGNFRIEPPGLFRGRGEHPRKGCLKFRVAPEDIVINIGDKCKIPVPNAPGTWGKVQHDQTVTWLANWKENVNGNFKYVFLAAGSSLKGQSDMNKFEKARELKKHVARIRQDYNADLKSKVMADRQRATAMYFIDKLALRAGNEKGEDEADTVGCCSLRYEHVTLEPPNHLIFDFLGKDSIRYYNTVPVDAQVFKNMRIFKGDGKTEKDAIFDRVTTTLLNKHLQSYMKGLTAKVFRTYNASITFQEQLDLNTKEDMSDAEKLAAYHEANRMVAILCNHQKSVAKNFGTTMEKMTDKIRGLKYQRMKLRHVLFTLDKGMKKQHKHLTEMESDLDDEFVVYWEDELKAMDIEKAKKKFKKTNEARVAEGEKPEPEKVLDATISSIEDEYKALKKERGTEKVDVRGYKDTDRVLAAIEKVDERIRTAKVNMDVKDRGKDVSLGTSKINYLDPRITAAWCKKFEIPISKLFSKTLLTKFPWAMEVDDDWKF